MVRPVPAHGPAAVTVALAVMLAGALGGCTASSDSPIPDTSNPAPTGSRSTVSTVQPPAQRGAPGPVRTDTEPLTKRFPALGAPAGATWQSGTLGDTRAPGPSSYWIDAVVRIAPEALAALPAAAGLERVDPPAVSGGVRPALPAGPWYAGDALDRALAGNGFGAQVYLDPAASTVVLLAQGGN